MKHELDGIGAAAPLASRLTAGLVLTLVGLMMGLMVPSSCLGEPITRKDATQTVTTPGWVPTGNLNTPRRQHTATRLQDGKVLVVGGVANGDDPLDVLDTAELYDPATGTWNVTGHLNRPRVGHTATLLLNGRVLVAGGWCYPEPSNSVKCATAELYDPVMQTWSLTGSLTTGRSGSTATLLQTGKVLVTGGPCCSAELYDTVTATWNLTGSRITVGDEYTATLLANGQVLIAGGSADADLVFGVFTAELYDPATGKWDLTGNLIGGRASHTATLLPDGKVLAAGGYISEAKGILFAKVADLFDPGIGRWAQTGALNVGRIGHTATLLGNGKVLLAGGSDGYVDIDSAELYDPISATWQTTAKLNTARHGHTATLLANGKVLVAGGAGGLNAGALTVLNSAELYEQAPLPGTIGPGFTGAWFDPAQNGHGLFIEVLPNNRLLAAWFTFNPAGTQQAWFVGAGTYSGNTATITAVSLPTGGRWIPNFDPNQIVNNLWGTLTFTFTDCNHGKVDFSAVVEYGTGSMNLTRLTQPAGVTCP